MGSTFKGFTVAIGLDTGVAEPEHHLRRAACRSSSATGRSTTTTRRGKVLTLVEVFQHSSNIGTAKLADGDRARAAEQAISPASA